MRVSHKYSGEFTNARAARLHTPTAKPGSITRVSTALCSRDEEIDNKCGFLTLLARERHKLHTNNVNYSYIFALLIIALRATFWYIIATQKSSF